MDLGLGIKKKMSERKLGRDFPANKPSASGPGVKLAAIIYYDQYLQGNEVTLLPTVADDATQIQELLEENFKYQILAEDPNPNVPQSSQENNSRMSATWWKEMEGQRGDWHNCGHLPDLLPWTWH